ncbi:hypothetical protein H310_13971 [Aphanomyces invadans]|uniref:PNPLA domain-containing protein n=1 Tax=Aphanomyces invadans TaxID=157072 RepID=A0A024TDP3_9STRA|nr:hypothetical protein H310_13971 [Aphanomyces invadans]ETV91422.1 hypothetical protein H310_13971 [Aphanomyces invadans]RHY26171.1 hypothetical protein DYB32_007836 [Aphanomyces invadans]|eukprot:XP_008879874.1 hypothetical protein H310_13971 [Aphanomyces invadans]
MSGTSAVAAAAMCSDTNADAATHAHSKVLLPQSYSFACSGWLKSYLFGVGRALQDMDLHRDATMLGTSGGSLAALSLCLDNDFDEMVRGVVKDMAPTARSSIRNAFRVREYLDEALQMWGNFDRPGALEQAKRCVIVYSSISKWTSRRKSVFDSIEDLTTSIHASCCAVPICGLPFRFNGEWVMDGGLFDFQPVLDESTVTISPFYCTQADIKPSQYVPMWWAMYPPEPERIQWLYELGKHDAFVWALKNGYTTKTHVSPTPLEASSIYQTKLGRFLGYKMMESHVLDFFFVLTVVVIWKPIAFALLYTELWLRAFVHATESGMLAVSSAGMWSWVATMSVTLALIGAGLVLPTSVLQCVGMGMCIMLCFFSSCSARLEKSYHKWGRCLTCVQLVFSMSLFLRTIPVVGSRVNMKKHKWLVEHSIVYRLTKDFL